MSRCQVCYGSGKKLGAGMILLDCESCDSTGKIHAVNEYLDIKSTESYKKAKAELQEQYAVSDDEAEKYLDKAFEDAKPKRGRPKKNAD